MRVSRIIACLVFLSVRTAGLLVASPKLILINVGQIDNLRPIVNRPVNNEALPNGPIANRPQVSNLPHGSTRRVLSEHRQNLRKALADLPDHRRRIAKEVALLPRRFLRGAIGGLRVMLARARVEMLPRAFDGETLVVEQMLNLQHQLHVLTTVQTMAFSGLLGTERRKLRFPESQHVGLDACQPADLPNAKVQLIRNLEHLI